MLNLSILVYTSMFSNLQPYNKSYCWTYLYWHKLPCFLISNPTAKGERLYPYERTLIFVHAIKYRVSCIDTLSPSKSQVNCSVLKKIWNKFTSPKLIMKIFQVNYQLCKQINVYNSTNKYMYKYIIFIYTNK